MLAKTVSRVALLGFSAIFVLNVQAQPQVHEIKEASSLVVGGNVQVNLTLGEPAALVLKGEQECLDHFELNQKGQKLELKSNSSSKSRWWHLGKKNESCLVNAELSLSQLEELEISGASEIKVTNPWEQKSASVSLSGASELKLLSLAVDTVEIDLSGATEVNVKQLKAERLDISVSGASSVKISGATDIAQLSLDASGASDVKAATLNFSQGSAQLSGASSANLGECGHMDASLSGVSELVVQKCRNSSVERSGHSTFTQR